MTRNKDQSTKKDQHSIERGWPFVLHWSEQAHAGGIGGFRVVTTKRTTLSACTSTFSAGRELPRAYTALPMNDQKYEPLPIQGKGRSRSILGIICYSVPTPYWLCGCYCRSPYKYLEKGKAIPTDCGSHRRSKSISTPKCRRKLIKKNPSAPHPTSNPCRAASSFL